MSDIFFTNAASAAAALTPDLIEEGTHVTTWSGAWSPASSNNLLWRKFGSIVILFFPFKNVAAGATTTLNMDTPLPVNIRPTRLFSLNMSVINNTRQTGVAQFDLSGGIIVYGTDALGNFSTGLNCGMDNATVTYFID